MVSMSFRLQNAFVLDWCWDNFVISLQAQYNLLCRSTEWELLEVCKIEGVAMLPWSPLKGWVVQLFA